MITFNTNAPMTTAPQRDILLASLCAFGAGYLASQYATYQNEVRYTITSRRATVAICDEDGRPLAWE